MEKFRDICSKVNPVSEHWGLGRDPLGVWLGPLYIEPSYVTSSELS